MWHGRCRRAVDKGRAARRHGVRRRYPYGADRQPPGNECAPSKGGRSRNRQESSLPAQRRQRGTILIRAEAPPPPWGAAGASGTSPGCRGGRGGGSRDRSMVPSRLRTMSSTPRSRDSSRPTSTAAAFGCTRLAMSGRLMRTRHSGLVTTSTSPSGVGFTSPGSSGGRPKRSPELRESEQLGPPGKLPLPSTEREQTHRGAPPLPWQFVPDTTPTQPGTAIITMWEAGDRLATSPRGGRSQRSGTPSRPGPRRDGHQSRRAT